MAHEYRATVRWERGADASDFRAGRYSRKHAWGFDGIDVPASAAPESVPVGCAAADAVDPEEAVVAAVSSCHMLFFLVFAAKQGFVVDAYEDHALGVMTRNEHGKLFISKVTLAPAATFGGDKRPSAAEIDALHHRAHEECYIANSLRAEIVVDARTSVAV